MMDQTPITITITEHGKDNTAVETKTTIMHQSTETIEMPPFTFTIMAGQALTFTERQELEQLRKDKAGWDSILKNIADEIGAVMEDDIYEYVY